MKTNRLAFMAAALAAVLIGSASADILWNGSAGDTLWRTGGNWSTGQAPAPGVGAIFINNQTNGTLVLVDALTDTTLDSDIFGPEWGMTLEIDGGNLTTTGWSFAPIGDVANPSIIQVRNGGNLTVHNLLLGDNWWFGTAPGVILNLYDTSTVTATDWCWLGGKMNLYGGTVDVTGSMNMDTNAQGFANLNIHGGTLIVRGADLSGVIDGWIASGYLSAYDTTPGERGAGSIVVDTETIPGGTILTATPSLAAREPNPMPQNPDGSVGTLISGSETELTLHWKAGVDPNEDYAVHPDILVHYVYWGDSEETLVYQGSVPHTDWTDPNVSYGPITLSEGMTYTWSVEEGFDDGTGTPYGPGDPNNVLGPIWSFVTKGATPTILTDPAPAVADPDASFSVTASDVTTHYQWFKAGDPDVTLSDNGIYSGTDTDTLTVTGAAIAEEGQYYCIAYSGLTPSAPSAPARLWTRRLMGHWKLDGDLTDSVAQTVAGAPAHDGSMAGTGPGDPNYTPGGGLDGGGVLEFFNDGDYVTIADADFFNFYPLGFTASFWYKEKSYVGWRLPLSKLDPGTAGWLFGVDSDLRNQAVFITNPDDGVEFWADGNDQINVGDGQWHMITVIYNPATTTYTIYTDGDENESIVLDLSAYPPAAAPLSIGGRETELSVDGYIDDVRIYSQVLEPVEVAQLYLAFETDKWVCVEDQDDPLGALDLDGDCRVMLSDFAMLASRWLECQRYPQSACVD